MLNAAITDLRTRASSLGGIQVCFSTTRPSGASLDDGDMIFEGDTKRMFVYNAVAGAFRGVRPARAQSVGTAQSGFSAETTIITQTFPDQGCSGVLMVAVNLRVDKTVASDDFSIRLKNGATEVARFNLPQGIAITQGCLPAQITQAAGASTTINVTVQRNGGTGTATTYADPLVSTINTLFVPDS